jgi:hypothetical protein
MSGEQTERVFVSYSHDSPAHAKRVLDLADRLRSEGVDAWIDQYESSPAEGWPRWLHRQIEAAAFVLVICTETYRRRFDGEDEPGTGRGATWEGLLASQMLDQKSGQNDRLIPVLFEGDDEVVPASLLSHTRYPLPAGYDDLYRRLTHQPKVVPPKLGPQRKLPSDPRAFGFGFDFSFGGGRAGQIQPKEAPPERRPPLPPIAPASLGLPDLVNVEAPFIVGPPIEKAEHFFGRQRELDEIRDALTQSQAVQLVGETRMGKTSLLNRVPDLLASVLAGVRPVARINAQGLAGHSAKDLVLAIAGALGRGPEIERQTSDGRPDSVLAALEQLMPCAVLVDEADALAQTGHGFDKPFFDQCRTLGQDRRLIWVSASHSELGALFKQTGLTSRFLSDSEIVHVALLDPGAADALVKVLGPAKATRARELAGGFALGLQWLGHELWRTGDHPLLAEDFTNAMKGFFADWWQRLAVEERKLLKRACAGIPLSSIGDGERRRMAGLVQRGLAEQENGHVGVPGAAWRGFVGDGPTPSV